MSMRNYCINTLVKKSAIFYLLSTVQYDILLTFNVGYVKRSFTVRLYELC